MKESAGKQTARELFYNDCLPSWLTPDEIQASNFLTLLGEEGRELPLTDELGVMRNRIWSVERDLSVYNIQNRNNWGVSLYYGEAVEYLDHLLHSNQQFKVLVLDIEGSHIAQLDSAMESIVLYAWRNTKTVVATYSTIGRDVRTLLEGIASFAIFLALTPERTLHFVSAMYKRYAVAGFSEPMRMVFRDLFWMRSVFEGVYTATAAVGVCSQNEVYALFQFEQALWKRVTEGGSGPLYLSHLLDVAGGEQLSEKDIAALPKTTLHVDDMYTLVYRAGPPWNHSGRFVRFGVHADAPVTPVAWIEHLMELFIETIPSFINRNGEVVDCLNSDGKTVVPKQSEILWNQQQIWSFKPRAPVDRTYNRASSIASTVQSIRESRTATNTGKQGVIPMTGTKALMFVDRTGRLTDYAKAMIQKLGGGRKLTPDERLSLSIVAPNGSLDTLVVKSGRQDRLDTNQVCSLLPSGINRPSVTACIAIGRRKKCT